MNSFIFLIFLIPVLSAKSLPDENELFQSIVSSLREVESQDDLAEAKNICYDKHEIGCFYSDRPLNTKLLPKDPDKIKTKFLVYKNGQTNYTYVETFKPDTFKNIPVNGSLAVLIHGFGGNGQSTDMQALRAALLPLVSAIIVVNWHEGAKNPNYPGAATNTQVVGRQVAVLINKLKNARRINPDNVHLLGFSLGAHVTGFAGKWSQEAFSWKFGRISGLDAAAPLFEGHKDACLTKADAKFVEGLHTSAGNNILKGEVGFREPFGHVDFFPNGGVKQPKCHASLNPKQISCNHGAAIVYYHSSITAKSQCRFSAYKCKSWDEFDKGNCKSVKSDQEYGYESIKFNGRGLYFLRTSKEYPFCNV